MSQNHTEPLKQRTSWLLTSREHYKTHPSSLPRFGPDFAAPLGSTLACVTSRPAVEKPAPFARLLQHRLFSLLMTLNFFDASSLLLSRLCSPSCF